MSTRTTGRTTRKRKVARDEVTRAICGAATRSGRGPCQRDAGDGTDHYGVGRCSLHMGATENHDRHAANVMVGGRSLIKDGPVMGIPIQMEPTDALLWCVSITAGEVAWLTDRVQTLTEETWTERPVSTQREHGEGEKGYKDMRTTAYGPKDLALVIRERQRAVDRLARFAKMAIDAGVAERTVALAERQGDIIAHVLGQFMERIGLTSKQLATAERVLPALLLELESPAVMLS